MSASQEERADWLGAQFWDRLDRLEGRHQRIQSEHEAVRRGLERVRVTPNEAVELRNAWCRYCEVIAELDKSAAEFEALHAYTGTG